MGVCVTPDCPDAAVFRTVGLELTLGSPFGCEFLQNMFLYSQFLWFLMCGCDVRP